MNEWTVQVTDSRTRQSYVHTVQAPDKETAYASVMDDYPRWVYCDGVRGK